MAKKLPKKDVVVGLGWCGSILAHELADAGLDVVAIDRGPWRDTATDFNIGYAQDELRYVHRHELMLSASEETYTFRNDTGHPRGPFAVTARSTSTFERAGPMGWDRPVGLLRRAPPLPRNEAFPKRFRLDLYSRSRHPEPVTVLDKAAAG